MCVRAHWYTTSGAGRRRVRLPAVLGASMACGSKLKLSVGSGIEEVVSNPV